MARKPLRLGVAYDFRNPPKSGLTHQQLYAAIMEQVVWLDGLGLDLVWFTEHHFVDDGYLPSWIPVAAAMAARTKHVRFSCDVCLLPFNHPIRLAEDLAVLDNISAAAGSRSASAWATRRTSSAASACRWRAACR